MVKIVQLLCPERHCLLACAYEQGNGTFEECCDTMRSMLSPAGAFNNYCGICGSADISFEEGMTRFKTMLEAAPFLTATAMANMQTRQVMDSLGMTYDKVREN